MEWELQTKATGCSEKKGPMSIKVAGAVGSLFRAHHSWQNHWRRHTLDSKIESPSYQEHVWGSSQAVQWSCWSNFDWQGLTCRIGWVKSGCERQKEQGQMTEPIQVSFTVSCDSCPLLACQNLKYEICLIWDSTMALLPICLMMHCIRLVIYL